MTPISYSLLPDELWGIIISSIQHVRTSYSVQLTSTRLKRLVLEYMSDDLAGSRIFFKPELYHTLPRRLQESRIVVLKALTRDPLLIIDTNVPRELQNDQEMRKIAFVGATLLLIRAHKEPFPNETDLFVRYAQLSQIQRRLKPSFESLEEEMRNLTLLTLPKDESELWSLPSFFLHGPEYISTQHYKKASLSIRQNHDLALILRKRGLNVYSDLDPTLKGDHALAPIIYEQKLVREQERKYSSALLRQMNPKK